MKNFITLEGGECSGKTTIINAIIKKLEELNIDYITTREPGGVKIAEEIRNVILNVNNSEMTSECEALLYAASRIQNLKQKVIPAINSGKVVICDRFLDSSIAYQGVGRNLGINTVLNVNSFALEYMPDLTLFIDVTPEVALKRINNADRLNKSDRLDQEAIDFHQRVYSGFMEVLKMYPNRVVRVDGNQPLDKVVDDCIKIVLNYLGK